MKRNLKRNLQKNAHRKFTARSGSALLALLLAAPGAQASGLELAVEIPRLQVAEYHRPYVAIWLEDGQRRSTQLAVWYDLGMREQKGQEWLKDLRQWWRRGGRSLELPIDGVTAATRAPGMHTLSFAVAEGVLKDLPAGDYQLKIEAAREVGGRELVEIPLTWPLAAGLELAAAGSEELGKITLRFNPGTE